MSGQFMPETLAQVVTACCVLKKLYGHCLSRLLVLPSPALAEFSILELPRRGIYWISLYCKLSNV